MHGLADQPPRAALLSRQSRRGAIPIVLASARDFGTETPDRRFEFVQHCGEIAVDVPESVCSQVVEHWFQRRPILGAGAIKPHGVGHVDVAQVADVLDHRPDPPAWSNPERLRGNGEDCPAQRRWKAADDLDGVRQWCRRRQVRGQRTRSLPRLTVAVVPRRKSAQIRRQPVTSTRLSLIGRQTLQRNYPLYPVGLGGSPGAGLEFGGTPGDEASGTFDVQIRMSCSPSL